MIFEQKVRRTFSYFIAPNEDPVNVVDWAMFPWQKPNHLATQNNTWEPNLWISNVTLELYPGQLPVFAPSERNDDNSVLDDWSYQRQLDTKMGVTLKFYEVSGMAQPNGQGYEWVNRQYGEQKLLNYGKIYTVDLLAFFIRHRAYYSDRKISLRIDYPLTEAYDPARNIFIFCVSIEGSVSWFDTPTQKIELL